MVQTNEIIVQKFEWFWDNREIWTDGRKMPNVEDYGSRFNGYSVGKWEGDTLVVTTVGLDDRQWVDAFGFPLSDQAVLEERYSRPSPNRLRLEMTLTDPRLRAGRESPFTETLINKRAVATFLGMTESGFTKLIHRGEAGHGRAT